MRVLVRVVYATVSALLFSLMLLPVAAAAGGVSSTTCDGVLAPGAYARVVVPEGGTCDAGVGPVTIRAGVMVGKNGSFFLGFEGGPSTGSISGGVTGIDAAQVLVHNARINGGVSINGGSGPFGCAEPYGGVCASDLEDDVINGGAVITGYDGFWLGFIRNHVNGTVFVANNTLTFDEIDLGSNVVNGSLLCAGNVPVENNGASPGPGLDQVTGRNTCHEVA